MTPSSRREILSIERSLPTPRTVGPDLSLSRLLKIFGFASFVQQGADAFSARKIAENLVSGKLVPARLFLVHVVLKEIGSPSRYAVGS